LQESYDGWKGQRIRTNILSWRAHSTSSGAKLIRRKPLNAASPKPAKARRNHFLPTRSRSQRRRKNCKLSERLWQRYELRGEWFDVPAGELACVLNAETFDSIFTVFLLCRDVEVQYCRDSVTQISGFSRIAVGGGVVIPISKQLSGKTSPSNRMWTGGTSFRNLY
jgi:hypothetical protein